MSGAAAVIARLAGQTSVTNDLDKAGLSIKYARESQGEAKPYIVVNSSLEENNDTYSGQNLDEHSVDVVIVSDFIQTKGARIGALNIAANVRTALHDIQGTLGGYLVAKIIFQNEEEPLPIHVQDKPEWEIHQTYRVIIRRTTATYTAISLFTYSFNNLSGGSGAITTMVPTVTGDVDYYKVADSDTSEWTTGGLVLNSVTGNITGTFATVNAEILAIGQDGLTIGAERVALNTVPHVANSDASYSVTLDVGETLALADYTTNIYDSGGALISTTVIPAMVDITINRI